MRILGKLLLLGMGATLTAVAGYGRQVEGEDGDQQLVAVIFGAGTLCITVGGFL